ncbi:MAG: Unknown protein [uncultured Sulfurovum sp.]|uniref:Uncharacterized protein n=1 Tax=uncultured Sulfurovum sp. TaxID=269237 RepID=A0A6S6T3R1_9BACT|nr:MAG: Unknown protein [uncultured Sulfurovum sp.]
MLTEALSALAINSSDVSLEDYQKIIAKQPIYKIEKSKNKYVKVSEKLKNETNDFLVTFLESQRKNIPLAQEVFINNFDRWEVEDSDNLFFAINELLNIKKEFDKEYIRGKRHFKGYPSLSSKLDELIELNNGAIKFINEYLPRAKEADAASKFMNTFISNNQEVLEALA